MCVLYVMLNAVKNLVATENLKSKIWGSYSRKKHNKSYKKARKKSQKDRKGMSRKPHKKRIWKTLGEVDQMHKV